MNLHPKVAVGSLAALLATVVQGVLAARGIHADPELASAITAVVGSLGGYLTPSPAPVTPHG